MEDRQHHDALWLGTKIHTIGEAANNDAADIRSGDGELKGVVSSLRNAALDLCHELESESLLPAFIPCACLDKFDARCAQE